MAIGKQVQHYRNKAGLTLEQLSELSGVERGTIGALEIRDSRRTQFATQLAAAFGMTVEMLEDADADYEIKIGSPVIDLRKSPGVAADQNDDDAGIRIPLLANSASMGPGTDIEHDDVVLGTLTLSPEWLGRRIRPTSPGALRFIHAYGDSMSPTLEDGDVALVDTGRTNPSGADGVYVLATDERVFIKRVTERMDGTSEITSDNPAVKTVQTLNGDHQIRVLGRVLWVWNGRKL